jgi:hypothetical protein
MIKIVILLMPLYLFAIISPYQSLDVHEKLNVMINYFLNESLKNNKPPIPIKRKLKDDGATLDPVKYELYFSYIQRLKAIKESRAEEQEAIDEEYAGKIGFYNGKLNSLKEHYEKKENLDPILVESVNRAFKVVFGKPTFTNIEYNNEINLLKGKLNTFDMYEIENFKPKDVELFVYAGKRDEFMEHYTKANLKVRFNYDEEYLTYKDVFFTFGNEEFIGKFLNRTNEKIKLDIKINDDIFRKVKIGEIK